MTIQKITIRGFKSFAKHTELVFPDGFSCVIGPNGSGKSNIADALTFVLGKISAKGLRAEKSANLIWNGGKKGSPAKEAMVSIHFDNSDKKFPFPEKSVKITRIVKTSGNSRYHINDKKHTRQEVLDLLNKGKISQDGHNIILQGDIIKFAEMKPEERRKLIEEISGISVYEDKKEQALRELDKVEKKLSDANIILKEREVYLRELKKDKDQALKYKGLESKIKSNKATILHTQITENEKQKESFENKIKSHEKQKESFENKINQLKEDISKRKEELKEINSEIERKGGKDQLKINKEVDEIKTKIIELNSKLNTYNLELIKIKQRKENLNKDLKEIGEKINSLNKENKILEFEKNKISLELNTIKNNEKGPLSNELSNNLKEKEDEIEEIQKKINNSFQEKQNFIREKDMIKFKLENLEKILNDSEKYNITNKKEEFKKIILNLNKKIDDAAEASLKLNNLRKKIIEKNEELSKLNIKKINVQESLFENISHKKIKVQKGVCGTIAELGEVEDKYSLALGVAAGARIKSIVTEDENVAIRCINFLKSNKLGVLTFLPLNKIKPKIKPNSSINYPGIYGYALDLIKFDDKYKNIFSYIFGSTIVVKDLDTVKKIGIGNKRMVTLEGDLVEVSGAMIGGHIIKKNIGFQEKNINKNIKNLENEIFNFKKDALLLENKKNKLEEEIIKFKSLKYETEGEIIKFEKSFNIKDIENLRKNREDLLKEENKINKNLKENDENIDLLNKKIFKLKENKNLLLSKLQNQDEIKILDDKKQKLIEFGGEIKNKNLQINIHQKEKERILNIIKQSKKEIEEFNENNKKDTEILIKEKEILKKKEKIGINFYNEFKNLNIKRNKVNDLVQKLDSFLIKNEEKIRSVERNVNEISLKKAKTTAELEGLKLNFEEFKNEKIMKNNDINKIRLEIIEFEKILSSFGNINMKALEIFTEIEKEYNKILNKSEKLKIEKGDILNLIQEIENKKINLFIKNFKEISKNFEIIFSQLTTKGRAYLELEDKENPFNGGLDIKVKIKGNRYLDLKSLSGGEKTMAALSFIFSIQDMEPCSFYFLDEVDAALDKTNSELLSKLISKYSKKAQYIVISHNDSLITDADQIYGVSMQDGATKTLSLKV